MSRVDVDVRYSMVPEWVLDFEQAGLSANAVRLYAVLARYGNSEGGGIFPGRQTLADRMGVKKLETVDKAARELRSVGAMSFVSGKEKGKPNTYRLIFTPPQGALFNGVPHETGHPADGGTGVPRSTGHDREKTTERDSPNGESRRRRAAGPDPVWDVLVELFGPVVEKTNAHAKRNKAVKDLKALGADVDSIKAAYRAWPRSFEGATVTDVALATHYPQIAQTAGIKAGETRRVACDECGVGGGLHVADCSQAAPIEKLAAGPA